MVLISGKNINKVYSQPPSQTHALKDISLDIKKGEFVAIVGPSGSGKSTLMHVLGCLDRPSNGQYFFERKEVSLLSEDELAKIRNQKIGFVFQTFNLLPRTTSLENVKLPLVYSSITSSQRDTCAKRALVQVGLSQKLSSTPAQLSGGEQQRVAIARALVNNPSLILADEPTGNLDIKTGSQIIKIFKDLNKKGKTIVIVTHNPRVSRVAKRIIFLRDGQIVRDTK